MPLQECKICGHSIPLNSKFCSYCGKIIQQKNTSRMIGNKKKPIGCFSILLIIILFVIVKNQIKKPYSPEEIRKLLEDNINLTHNNNKNFNDKISDEQNKQLFIDNAISIAAKKSVLNGPVGATRGKDSGTDYSITVEYLDSYNACGDIYMLTQEFVRYLVSAGLDPSIPGQYKPVHTWAIRVGVKTVSGKQGVIDLCDVHYNPYKDNITR